MVIVFWHYQKCILHNFVSGTLNLKSIYDMRATTTAATAVAAEVKISNACLFYRSKILSHSSDILFKLALLQPWKCVRVENDNLTKWAGMIWKFLSLHAHASHFMTFISIMYVGIFYEKGWNTKGKNFDFVKELLQPSFLAGKNGSLHRYWLIVVATS